MKRFTRDETEHGQEYYLTSDADKALAQPALLPYIHSQWQEMIAGIPVTFESEADAKRFLAAQPAQEPDNGDELTIAYMSGVHRGKELATQPAQEPVAWMREDATLRFSEGKVFAVGQPFYTAPQQRPWVGLTVDERYECVHGDAEDSWDVAEAVEAKLKELNQ